MRCAIGRTLRICRSPQALAVVERLAPDRAFFTHMCHDLPHVATCARLPEGVELAYDGLAFEISLRSDCGRRGAK